MNMKTPSMKIGAQTRLTVFLYFVLIVHRATTCIWKYCGYLSWSTGIQAEILLGYKWIFLVMKRYNTEWGRCRKAKSPQTHWLPLIYSLVIHSLGLGLGAINILLLLFGTGCFASFNLTSFNTLYWFWLNVLGEPNHYDL